MRIGNEYAAKTLCKAVQACYNFSVYTEDGAPSAQWEVTVAVTEDGYEILAY